METRRSVRFAKGTLYTRSRIHEVLGGGSRTALPTRAGLVVCACLTLEKNPRAPDEMLVDGRERAVRLARAFAASGTAVPVFVRARRGGWEYTGERRVRSVVGNASTLPAPLAAGVPVAVALTLLLEEVFGETPTADRAAADTTPIASNP